MVEIVADFTLENPEEIEADFQLITPTADHNKLYNRNLADQHPISAITGLEDAISSKQDILTSENAGTGISIEIEGGVVKINNTQNSAEWGQIGGDINQQTDLKTALDNKQDKLTQVQLDAVNSGANTTNIGHIATNTSDIADINALIPNQATTSNQLADKNFVNSSIATNTAYFIGTFNSVAELEAYSGTLTNNDYAFVATTDTAGNTLYDRYKWNGSQWLFEYELNNSSFTADQWASINSNATTANIAKISTNETAINNHIANKSNPHEVTKSQVGLSNVDNTSDLNKPISTATQTALNAKQNTIADLSTIRSGAALGATAVQPETLTTELLKKQDVLTAGTDIEIVKGGGGVLPQGFQQLEYIEGNNNAQYINTDIVPTSSMNMYVKMQYISVDASTPTQVAFLMGARDVGGQYGLFLQLASTSVGLDWFVVNGRWSSTHTRTVGDVVELKVNNSLAEIWLNGTSVGTHQYTPNDTTQYSLFLNALDNIGEVFSNVNVVNRIYRFTIEGLCDMLPAIRQSDNAVGMYDIIRNRFFANAGTGTFIAGPATTLPNGYKQVEYIESTGTQYIDTGVVPNQDTSVELDGSIDGYGIFFGVRTAALVGISTIQGTSTEYWAMGYNTEATPFGTKDANRHTWYKDKNKQYMDGDLKQNYTYTNFTAMGNAYLFAYNNNGTVGYVVNGTVRVYSCKIYDNDTLVRDFVPCLDTNNVACMYDMVGKQAYYNAGTGIFEAGEVVGDGFVINFTNESGFIKSSDLTGYEQISNKVTSLSSSSTDTEYPSAKCVYDIVGDIETLINAL